mmetsp:Transcript_25297/g.35440  ORF Transcript_25297/g.35440 Transcript_25297/m.35440 type:complete len:199 (-) Transcript_25297:125-721(-)
MSGRTEPVLKHAGKLNLPQNEIGQFRYSKKSTKYLEFSDDATAVDWKHSVEPAPCWIPVETESKLHSGKFTFDFDIENMANRQIGVGFLLDWNIGPDWGFFGYLGSSGTAWSYDPSTGDIVRATESIQGGLPVIKNNKGVITLELFLPRDKPGYAKFIIDGVDTPKVELPEGAVVVPAACLLALNQKVALKNMKRESI